ncbi:MAG: hypothetical protein HFG82_01400 [Dorea sp.]|jgi:hypothetical protein|nr:hypothetical protein [Dorea sp.]
MDASRRIRARKRRREVQRQIFLLSWLLVFLIVVLFCCQAQKKEDERMAKQVVKAQSSKKTDKVTVEVETDEQRLKRVKKEAVKQGYPDSVIELLDKNVETVDFVEQYGEKKDKPSPDSIEEEFAAGTIPKLYQYDERWGYAPYGTSIVAISGCGPTCMAMVASGLNGDPTITPPKVAAYGTENFYVDENNDTYWAFMKEAGENWNLSCYDVQQMTEEQVKEELTQGKPIICSMSPGDFTQNGHFIVLTGYEDGKVLVNDPFSKKNSSKGWTYSDISNQIRGMWVYSIEQ